MLSPYADEVRSSERTGQHKTQHPSRSRNHHGDPWPSRQRRRPLFFKFNADSSRVFYALSIPEYIEAWLRAPDTDELQFVFNQVAEDTFSIDLYRGQSLQASIDGSCWVVGSNQVRYVWKTTSPMGTTETLVDMKLLSGSGSCVLALRHSGFRDQAESARCSRMWHQSLERLCRIMEKA